MDNAYVKGKKDGIGFGIASLVLGIMSLCVCCFINYIFAFIAIVFGIIQIVSSKRKGMAIAGIVIAVVAIIISSVFWILIITDNVNINNDSKDNEFTSDDITSGQFKWDGELYEPPIDVEDFYEKGYQREHGGGWSWDGGYSYDYLYKKILFFKVKRIDIHSSDSGKIYEFKFGHNSGKLELPNGITWETTQEEFLEMYPDKDNKSSSYGFHNDETGVSLTLYFTNGSDKKLSAVYIDYDYDRYGK